MTSELFAPSELLLYAELFCAAMHSASPKIMIRSDRQELLLKVSQSRGLVEELQIAFNEDRLDMQTTAVREKLRCLVLALHWIGYYGGAYY